MTRLSQIEDALRLDEMLFKVCPEAFEEGWNAFLKELNEMAYSMENLCTH